MAQRLQHTPVLSVVVPVYNESRTWREVLTAVQAVPLPGVAKQVIVVDDGSTDGTRQQLEKFARGAGDLPRPPQGGQVGYKLLFHSRNRGKGAAVRTGFAAAAGDMVVVQDADLEYDPRDFPRLIRPILDGRADVVYGSRFRRGRPPRSYRISHLANRFLTALSNLATGLRLTDMETCYKVFRRDVLARIRLEQDRFGFEPEITAKLAALPVRLREVPIRYAGRTRAEGKKIGWRDGLKAIWCIVKYAHQCRMRAGG